MRTVLAAIDGGPTAGRVLQVARTWGSTLDARVRAVHARQGAATGARDAAFRAGVPLDVLAGDPPEVVLARSRNEVDLVVLGTRREVDGPQPAGHIALAVVEGAGVPVLVVPPEWVAAAGTRVRRILVALEGSAVTTASTGPVLRALADAGVTIVAVHVLTATGFPRFADHAFHAEEGLAAGFAARWCTDAPAEVRLRIGTGADAVLAAADVERPDAIALAWSQDLSPGRAAIVRAALAQSRRPVLLIPCDPHRATT